MAIFGAVAAEAMRRERERRLAECVARRVAHGMIEEDARAACERELSNEEASDRSARA